MLAIGEHALFHRLRVIEQTGHDPALEVPTEVFFGMIAMMIGLFVLTCYADRWESARRTFLILGSTTVALLAGACISAYLRFFTELSRPMEVWTQGLACALGFGVVAMWASGGDTMWRSCLEWLGPSAAEPPRRSGKKKRK